MKKIFGVLILVIILAGGFVGYRYYHDTYVGEVAYAKVPAIVPEKREHEGKSGIGKDSPWYSYDYNVIFVKEDGSTRKDTFAITGDNPTPLVPNSYVKVKISKNRVLEGPNVVTQSKIPKKAMVELDKLEQ